MINVSNEFKTLMNSNTNFKPVAQITLLDGTVLNFTDDEFTFSNNHVVDGSDSSSIPLGEAISRSIQIELINDEEQLSEYYFYGAKVHLYVTLQLSNSVERIDYGTFTVLTPETYGETVIITANDDMYRADKAFSTGLTFPQTAEALLRDICSTCDIPIRSTSFTNGKFIIESAPSSEYTFRQVIGFIAMIAGGNARIDRNGYLTILSYSFDYTKGYHELTEWDSLKTDTDDITITGIQTTREVTTTTGEGDESTTETVQETLLKGTEGYVLSVDNPLISGKEQEALDLIGILLINKSFRVFEGNYIGYPIAEFMDLVKVTDRKGNVYNSFITDITFTFYSFTTFKNSAESVARQASKYSSGVTSAIVKSQQLYDRDRSDRELMQKQLNELLKNSSGMFSTEDVQEDGSTIYYLHDKPTLAESKNVMKLTSQAIGFSTDGGKTYPFGFTIDGDAIMNIIAAEGLNADWIKTGALLIADQNGNVLFQADYDTKDVKISGETIYLGSVIRADNILRGTNVETTLDSNGTWSNGKWRIHGSGSATFTEVTDPPLASLNKSWKLAGSVYPSSKYGGIQQVGVELESGSVYTVSCYAKKNPDAQFGGNLQVLVDSEEIGTKSISSDTWTRVSFTFTASAATSAIVFSNNNTVFSIYVCGMTLNEGSVDKGWSESLYDIGDIPENLSAALELKIDRDKLISEINASADVIALRGNRFIVDSDNFKLSSDGTMEAVNGIFSGELNATFGTIGGFTIEEDCLQYQSDSYCMQLTNYRGLEIYNLVNGAMDENSHVILKDGGLYIGSKNLLSTMSQTSFDNYRNHITSIRYDGLYTKKDIVFIENGAAIYGTSATSSVIPKRYEMIGFSSSDNVTVGYSGVGEARAGNTNIYATNGNINLYVGNGTTRENVTLAYSSTHECALTSSTANEGLIGTSSNPWYNLYLSHCVYYTSPPTGSGTAVYINSNGAIVKYSSDRRLKNSIEPVTDEILNPEMLYDLPIHQYKYNNDVMEEGDDLYDKTVIGFIADEVEEVYPRACAHNEKGEPTGWNANVLLPAMLQLIKDQKEEINGLKKELQEIRELIK